MNKDFMWGDEAWQDVFDGKQAYLKHKKYHFNDMVGIIDIGKVRENNEDSLLMMEQGGARLMAVADGMGGYGFGELASNYVLLAIGIWFKERGINENSSEKKIYEDFKELLPRINSELIRQFGETGTTLALTITLKNRTFCLNIGDSRIYTFSQTDELEQILEDQSPAWYRYCFAEEGTLEKDDMRYMYGNNIIESALGGKYWEDVTVIGNDSYKDLFLFTDGVTDIVSEKMLEDMIKNIPPEEIDDKIIDVALNHYETKTNWPSKNFRTEIIGGKDNATLVHYKRLQRSERRIYV